ncbi:MAG: efflux RND transporter periplasmic adaptor subunit [Bacteroidota bacterium]
MDRKIEKKAFNWKTTGLYGGLAVVVVVLVSALYRDAGTSRLNVEADRLRLDTVQTGVFQDFIPVNGTVQPIKTVFLDAVEGGRVEERFVEDGAMVKAGTAILRLSNPDLQLNYLNQEANIVAQINNIRNTSILMEQQSLNLKEQALDVEFQLDLMGKRVNRNKELFADNVIARVEFEDTEDEFEHLNRRKKLLANTLKKDSMFQSLQQDQMNASLNLMQQNLSIARLSLDNLMVKAPIDGQLSGMDAEIGELIQEGSRIAQIDNMNNWKVRVRVDEFYTSRVSIGQTGSVLHAGKLYPLEIKKIYPEVSNGNFEVDMIFTEDAPTTIKRGQNLSIKLELSGDKKALLLARGSYFLTTGGSWVYVLDPATNTAFKRNIKVGNQNPTYLEVLDGLQAGEIVIVSSYDSYAGKDQLVLK